MTFRNLLCGSSVCLHQHAFGRSTSHSVHLFGNFHLQPDSADAEACPVFLYSRAYLAPGAPLPPPEALPPISPQGAQWLPCQFVDACEMYVVHVGHEMLVEHGRGCTSLHAMFGSKAEVQGRHQELWLGKMSRQAASYHSSCVIRMHVIMIYSSR